MSTPSHHPYESQDGVSCVSSSIQGSNTSHSLPIMSHLAPSLTPNQLLGVSADRLSEVVEGKLVSFLVIDISVIVIWCLGKTPCSCSENCQGVSGQSSFVPQIGSQHGSVSCNSQNW